MKAFIASAAFVAIFTGFQPEPINLATTIVIFLITLAVVTGISGKMKE